MNFTAKKSNLIGCVRVPSSKSVAHRMIISSLISGSRSIVNGSLNSDDIIATLSAIERLGAKVVKLENGVEIDASNLQCERAFFDVNESGSTMRFLLPLLPVYLGEFQMSGQGRIGKRSVASLRKAMGDAGVVVESDFLPTRVSGKYITSDFCVDASTSSQFVTGLLFTIVALGGGMLKINGELTSSGYVDVTIEVLKKYGVSIEQKENIYVIRVPRGIVPPKEICVNGDWSSACFWIVGGVLSGDVSITGLEYPDAQPDSIVLSVIKKMGGNVSYENGVVRATKSVLTGVEFDADGSPDIVPILAVACACARGVSIITGTRRLRLKESDRVKAITDMLSNMGVRVESGENYIKIWGAENIHSGEIDAVNDHRIAMSGIILGSVAKFGATIKGIECISKSYPDFIKDYVSLGGKYE